MIFKYWIYNIYLFTLFYFSGKTHISQLSLLVGFAQKFNYFIVHPIPTDRPVGYEPAIGATCGIVACCVSLTPIQRTCFSFSIVGKKLTEATKAVELSLQSFPVGHQTFHLAKKICVWAST